MGCASSTRALAWSIAHCVIEPSTLCVLCTTTSAPSHRAALERGGLGGDGLLAGGGLGALEFGIEFTAVDEQCEVLLAHGEPGGWFLRRGVQAGLRGMARALHQE